MSNTLNNNPFSFDNSNGSNCVTFHGDGLTEEMAYDAAEAAHPQVRSYNTGTTVYARSAEDERRDYQGGSDVVVSGNDGDSYYFDPRGQSKAFHNDVNNHRAIQAHEANVLESREGMPPAALMEDWVNGNIPQEVSKILMDGQLNGGSGGKVYAANSEAFLNFADDVMANPDKYTGSTYQAVEMKAKEMGVSYD